MKKKISILLMAVMLTAAVTACGENTTDRNSDEVQAETQAQETEGMVHLGSAEDVAAFIEEVQGKIPSDKMPMSLATTELDLADPDMVSYHTGLTDLSQIEGITISEPMMSSVAYSMVYIRTKDGADAEAIRQSIMDNVDPAKWLCVTAEKQIAGIFGNDVFFIMTEGTTADLIYDAAAQAAESRDMKVSERTEKVNPV